jgi:hypothetical protein
MSVGEALHEREGCIGDLAPAAVDRERVPAIGNLDDLCHSLAALLLFVGGVGDREWDRVVLLAGDDQQGPRSGFFVSTFALVHGLRLAVAACKSGAPGVGTA